MTSQRHLPGAKKGARLTVTPEQIRSGELCRCEACVRDGQHEPDCPVHDEPPGACGCDRTEQSQGAG
jgi:hypothetical protein